MQCFYNRSKTSLVARYHQYCLDLDWDPTHFQRGHFGLGIPEVKFKVLILSEKSGKFTTAMA